MSLLIISLSSGCVACREKYPADMPDDFYFIYEEGFSPSALNTLLDTKKGVIGKDLVVEGYISAAYDIPQESLQGIYDLIVQYDIRAYSNQNRFHVKSYFGSDWLAAKDVFISPNLLYKFTFCVDGKIYEIKCDSSALYLADKKYDNLSTFNRIIRSDFYINTPEYQAFPPVNGGWV